MIVGRVWVCDDDWCGCSQAIVYEQDGETVTRIWDGPFHANHEEGADRDLAEYRRSLSPERAAEITWQRGIS